MWKVISGPERLVRSLRASPVLAERLSGTEKQILQITAMKILFLSLLILTAVPSLFAQSATVNWNTTYQTMDGFGGMTATYGNSLSGAQADLFFSATAGIGMAYVRTANTEDNSIPDLVTLQEATARGALIELSLMSPPLSIKSSSTWADGTYGPDGSTCFSSNPSLASNYTTYANYIVNYINTMATSVGAPVSVLGVGNEPNILHNSYGSCQWTAATIDTFVGKYLGPALAKAAWNSVQKSSPKLMLPETSGWFNPDFASACLNDSVCAQYVNIVAAHDYGSGYAPNNGYCCALPSAYPLGTSSGRHLWMSETNGGLIANNGSNCPGETWCDDTSMADALVWAKSIHDFFTVANASGWQYWELIFSGNLGYWTETNAIAQRFWAVGNWSKFVRPGWQRIEATTNPKSGIYVSAFKDSTNTKFAIVAINQNSSAETVDFSFSGFPSVTSVTPTLTSASVNLVDQTDTNVSSDAFFYSIPATSVVTFHGTVSSSSKAPAAPTNLTVSVH